MTVIPQLSVWTSFIEHVFCIILAVRRLPSEVLVIHSAQFRVLGEQNPCLEHRHGERWVRMDRTIPVLNDGQPRAYRSAWVCRDCGETVLHEWRAS